MTSRSTSALRKPNKTKPKTASKTAGKSASKDGKLPEWDLADLYSGIDAPEVGRDLAKMDADCVAFETDYKGTLSERTAQDGGGRRVCGSRQALRGDRRPRRPPRFLCGPRSRRRQRRSRDLQILWRRVRTADGRLGPSLVLL